RTTAPGGNPAATLVPQPRVHPTCTLKRMRLIVRRIYRAFPELDRYTDEQCRRFVRAARRGGLRIFHWFITGLVGWVSVGVVALGLAFIADRLERHRPISFEREDF